LANQMLALLFSEAFCMGKHAAQLIRPANKIK